MAMVKEIFTETTWPQFISLVVYFLDELRRPKVFETGIY